MKTFVNLIFLASVATVLSFKEFSPDEVYAFLKLVKPPPSCPVNELYKVCVSECSDCDRRGMCFPSNCNSGCDCAPRFFRLKPDGPCEPVANCPKPECGENEVFRECGPICEECTGVKCHYVSCDHRCYCKEGYLRNDKGECIPIKDCPKRERCFRNEEWADSGRVDEFCLGGGNGTKNDEIHAEPGCYCTEGYSRNILGYCINNDLCPHIKCLGVEVYHDCIPKCNTTCRNYGNPDCEEDENCYPGCFCPPGYLMNDFRSCIPVEECSLDLEQVKILDTSYEEDEDKSNGNETTSASPEKDLEAASTENAFSDGITDIGLKMTVTTVSPSSEPTKATLEESSAEDDEINSK